MKLISLTQGKFTQVDDWNYNWLNQWKWFALPMRDTYYAARNMKIDGVYHTVFMHRIIMGTPDNLQCDHENRYPLNNQEYNLRNCTPHQNGMNKTPWGKVKSMGVCIKKGKIARPFVAQIEYKHKNMHIGYFSTEEDAARAYDKKAKELFREFANLNFP